MDTLQLAGVKVVALAGLAGLFGGELAQGLTTLPATSEGLMVLFSSGGFLTALVALFRAHGNYRALEGRLNAERAASNEKHERHEATAAKMNEKIDELIRDVGVVSSRVAVLLDRGKH